jgi:hypothetical protein
MMRLHRFQDPNEFFERVKDYLLSDEAMHNLLLGLSNAFIQNPERFKEPPYLATVELNTEIIAVAIRTSGRPLILSQAKDLLAIEIIAGDLYPAQVSLPGVNAPITPAKSFAEIWSSLTGQPYKLEIAMRVLQLEQVQPVFDVPGYLRLGENSDSFAAARSADRELLIHWYQAFGVEALGSTSINVERQVDLYLQEGTVYLWENEVPVSMACCVGRTPNGWKPRPYRTALN